MSEPTDQVVENIGETTDPVLCTFCSGYEHVFWDGGQWMCAECQALWIQYQSPPATPEPSIPRAG